MLNTNEGIKTWHFPASKQCSGLLTVLPITVGILSRNCPCFCNALLIFASGLCIFPSSAYNILDLIFTQLTLVHTLGLSIVSPRKLFLVTLLRISKSTLKSSCFGSYHTVPSTFYFLAFLLDAQLLEGGDWVDCFMELLTQNMV